MKRRKEEESALRAASISGTKSLTRALQSKGTPSILPIGFENPFCCQVGFILLQARDGERK